MTARKSRPARSPHGPPPPELLSRPQGDRLSAGLPSPGGFPAGHRKRITRGAVRIDPWSSDAYSRPASTSARCAASWACPRSSRPTRSARPTRRPRHRRRRPSTAPTYRSSRRPGHLAATSTRRCTCAAAPAAATGSATRSPTSPRSSARAARSRRRPGGAGRPSTCPTATCRCTRTSLSEGAASLLPDDDRPPCSGPSTSTPTAAPSAVDAGARPGAQPGQARLRRACRRQPTPGRLARADRAAARDRRPARPPAGCAGAPSTCRCPSRSSSPTATAGGWCCARRLPVEEHNAQISLLTGMAAADIMLAGGIGLLRTMPAPEAGGGAAAAGRRRARWACTGRTARARARCIAGLDPASPRARRVHRPGGRADARRRRTPPSTATLPEQPEHGGVAAAYAHVTAPLRRLADRYATEVCLALHDGPDGARLGPRGAAAAARGDGEHRPGRLGGRAGRDRPGRGGAAGATGWARPSTRPSLDVDAPPNGKSRPRPPGGTVALDAPPVRARCLGDLPLGERVRVRLVTADPADPHADRAACLPTSRPDAAAAGISQRSALLPDDGLRG